MRLNFNLLSLAATFFAMANAASSPTCAEQSSCIQFQVSKKDADSCGVGGDCPVQVCMFVSGSLDGCVKGTDTFSHMCSQSDSGGCPVWSDSPTNTLPLLGYSEEEENCPDSTASPPIGTGKDDYAAFQGKCSGNDVLMCQDGKPGQTLYWVLKDGSNDTGIIEDVSYTMAYNNGNNETTSCNAAVRCFNGEYNCGLNQDNDTQQREERTWAFSIPDGTAGSCDVCGSTPPISTPTPPLSPNPPPAPEPTPTSNQSPTPTPGSNGDPHFKTWKNEHFEYHGQCDLVLTKDPSFADDLGIEVQIRTKLVRYWSYIRSAAIRIGLDIIELEGSDDTQDTSIRYWYNMEFRSPEAQTLGGFPMTIRRSWSAKTKVEIDLNKKYPGVKIVMATYKEFVKVEVFGANEEAFASSVGLLGDFKTGKTLARDGVNNIHDFSEYGQEWQVGPNEDMLFHDTAEPQFPQLCVEPENPRGDRRRRLAETTISLEEAEKACSRLKDPLDQKDCVYDILATQDIDMAGAF